MAEPQKAIDGALPGTTNTITCGNCLSSKFFLVHAASDRQPTRFLLFDPAANKFMGYALARPWIDAKQMGQRDFFRFRARDGMEIPVYLTLPPGWKKDERVPLIVLVHVLDHVGRCLRRSEEVRVSDLDRRSGKRRRPDRRDVTAEKRSTPEAAAADGPRRGRRQGTDQARQEVPRRRDGHEQECRMDRIQRRRARVPPGRAPDRLLEACRGVSAPMPRIFARSAVRQSAGYRAAWRQLRVPNPIARCGAAGAVAAEELLGPEPGR